jgi:hypothetical protein
MAWPVVSWVTALCFLIGIGVAIEAGIGVGTHGTGTATYGEACGVTALAGGPPGAVGVKAPSLLHECLTGPALREAVPSYLAGIRLVSAAGISYELDHWSDTGWTAVLPAGTYRAADVPGCTGYKKPFTVVPGKTTFGIVIYWGCEYS